MAEARDRDCELCRQPFRTVRLPVRVSTQPLDRNGVAIAYTLHRTVNLTGHWL